ncbi:Alpha-L-fucosidase [Planctomycetes bacterium CA13]|uniref:alpha-L-fucosidase n=1 Tax=Novipirellula herctigrandis TaxID=2527986 RepID=A0A5C5YLP7_9BACT|nr:Alpha-L-fucosidase [Planctomycetes bacterium CA13]
MKTTQSHFVATGICILFVGLIGGALAQEPHAAQGESFQLEQLQRRFVDDRFGMFICYNIMSYGAKWGEDGYDCSGFNPQKLDCNQWADAAASAGMRFGLLTTKHHEGFCLWDSEFTDYDVAGSPYNKDIVRQYVDAFRAKALRIGFYYSVWDSTHGISKGTIGPKEIAFIKGQIRELLTNYGEIDYFVIDGWFWKMGHHEVPFTEIREFIRELQPECLVTDHTHLQAVYHVDIPYFEGPFGAFPAAGNAMPSALGHCSVKGNGWFWGPETPQGLKPGENAQSIVTKLKTLESRYCNFMLNCMPNRDGLLDPLYIDLLAEIGTLWKPDLDRPPLPAQNPLPVYSIPIENVAASSGDPEALIDACQHGTEHVHWISDGNMPQTITLDLGTVYKGVDAVTIVPNHRCKPSPESALEEGNVTKLNVFAGVDKAAMTLVAARSYTPDAKPRHVTFVAQPTRYIKLEILESHGSNTIIAELAVGGSKQKPLASR